MNLRECRSCELCAGQKLFGDFGIVQCKFFGGQTEVEVTSGNADPGDYTIDCPREKMLQGRL